MSIFKIKKIFQKIQKNFVNFKKRIASTYPMFDFPAQNHDKMAFLHFLNIFFNITSHLTLSIS